MLSCPFRGDFRSSSRSLAPEASLKRSMRLLLYLLRAGSDCRGSDHSWEGSFVHTKLSRPLLPIVDPRAVSAIDIALRLLVISEPRCGRALETSGQQLYQWPA